MIAHVGLETDRVDRPAAVTFWRALGFAEVDPPATLVDRAAWLERDGTQIHLLWTDDPTVPPVGHVAVVLADYETTIAGLRDAGFDVEPRTAHWGAARAFTRAPGGHLVELMAAPPGGEISTH